jgi:FrmR/RcnR family transcriptional regulator, repressor of frmRAB operon
MAHLAEDKEKLLNRVRRIRGQLNAVEKAIDGSHDCAMILQRLVACRGAMSGLVVELLEGHVRAHVIDPDKKPTSRQAKGARELIDILKTYVR